MAESLKIRLAINLHASSVGFESLFHELSGLSDDKRRHRLLTIWSDYSRGLSANHAAPQTHQKPNPVTPSPHQMNVLTLPDLDLPKNDKPVSQPMSDRDAMREAMQLSGLLDE